ncbi:class I SAM-dependent methyltransferase [Corynebacterium frankenforstense]|uniref:class I SAM-dependent methyltransferase n=1 Tax=Corynebacterium frankenforstense TaxID=1230998 RepID=UPI0009530A5A|nr:class I SAM-dependent methyltransferase [Corynebacterium frankenforstense]
MTTSLRTDLTAAGTAQLQARLDRYWSDRAAAYHGNQMHGRRARVDRELWSGVFAAHLPAAPARILDCGTGSGYLAFLLADLGHDVVGVDTAEGMLAAARTELDCRRRAGAPEARFVRADAVSPAPGLAAAGFGVGVGFDAVGSADANSRDTASAGTRSAGAGSAALDSPTPGPATPGSAAGFDAVVSRFLLWTLRDPVAAVRSWAELLAPGGRVVCVDANWFPEGTVGDLEVESAGGPDEFARTYTDETVRSLPLAGARGPEAFARVFHAAGLADVAVEEVARVQELDAELGTAPGHESRPHYVVSGRV